MNTYRLTFNYEFMPEEIEVEAKNGDVAFEKAIKILKKELEESAFSGDLKIDDD